GTERRASARATSKRSSRPSSASRRSAATSSPQAPYSSPMTAQRRTALLSVFAAVALIALKLTTGLLTHSLGLLSEAAHSGTDLVAALLTFFAVGVAGKPADPGHQYGHGKAEHLASLGEGAILVLASAAIVWRAIARLAGGAHAPVHAGALAFSVIAGGILVDITRTLWSAGVARRYASA